MGFTFGARAAPRAIPVVLRELTRDALERGEVTGAGAGDGALACVAVWLPAGAPPPSPRQALRNAPAWLRVAAAAPRAVPRAVRVSAALDRLHPAGPHHFLSLLGTRRAARGRGLAGTLVRPWVARAAAEGVPAHLDTSRPENVAIYERLGFVVHAAAPPVPGAPAVWGMRTPAAG